MRIIARLTFLSLAALLAKLAHAGYCPTCNPSAPEYFTHTEAIAECVHIQATGAEEWEITLPNDHIWSGDDDGGRLKAFIDTGGSCVAINFTAMPIDEWGTVDASFVTAMGCGRADVETALYETMARRLAVKCQRMPTEGV